MRYPPPRFSISQQKSLCNILLQLNESSSPSSASSTSGSSIRCSMSPNLTMGMSRSLLTRRSELGLSDSTSSGAPDINHRCPSEFLIATAFCILCEGERTSGHSQFRNETLSLSFENLLKSINMTKALFCRLRPLEPRTIVIRGIC